MSNESYCSFLIEMDLNLSHLSYSLSQRKTRRRHLIMVRFQLEHLKFCFSTESMSKSVVKLLPERGHHRTKFGGQDANVVRTVNKKHGWCLSFLNTIHSFLQNNFVMEITSIFPTRALFSFVFPHSHHNHHTLIFHFLY